MAEREVITEDDGPTILRRYFNSEVEEREKKLARCYIVEDAHGSRGIQDAR